ncbi:MAG: hypothetical protein MCSN_1840 [Candidatus Microsyncoccus archaeolyticus]|nr:MAG: hypothetical protein MCSN_1840 [Candidatus Parcubacteria bacterium]
MSENRAHQEPRDDRLARFQNNPPAEIIDTLLNSIDNYFNNEIRITVGEANYQTSLLFLGIHSVALTISEGLFDKSGLDGYKIFLETFVDEGESDLKFSSIASLLHDWRNVLAHQWLGSVGHKIGYDYRMDEGWQEREGITFINPRIYCNQYLKAFGQGGKAWNYQNLLSEDELNSAKQRLINKYIKR